MLLHYYLTGTLILWFLLTLYLIISMRKIAFLKSQPGSEAFPALAIIIAVRNEEENLEEALRSVCTINYSNYRVVVVNDRSTDGTQQILERISSQYPQISIIHVTELPSLWLGKNHALYQGYLHSKEEWLLFTDADIVFEADAISRAMHYTLDNKLDHLTILPDVRSRSEWLNSILKTFSIMLCIRLRPWDARNPRSGASMGVGAFNLVRRTAYEYSGTHSAIRLRPDDDIKLGAMIKHAGLRQDVLYGDGQLGLEWYPSVGEFINGLMKNTFSVSEYNVSLAVLTGLSTFFFFSLPVPLGLISGHVAISISILLVQWALFYFIPGKRRWWDFLMISYAGALMAYIILKSTYLTLKNKGIYWRDSFYSLEDLKNK